MSFAGDTEPGGPSSPLVIVDNGNMLKRTAMLLLLATTLVAVSPAADLAHRKVGLKDAKKGKWEASAAFVRFAGNLPLTKAANVSMEAATRKRLAAFLKNAREFGGKEPMPVAYYLDESPTVNVANPTLLSVAAEVDSFEGGAHGYNYPVFDNWALVAGKPKKLRIEDLLIRGRKDVEAVSTLVMGKLAKKENADWVQEGTVRELDRDTENSFTITKKGLRYIFAPYVMGCYASGTIVVELSWSELKGLVNHAGPLKPLLK
jgi:hypothetical protein